MASNSISLLYLATTLILFTLTNAVSDSDLILVCSKTEEPSFCEKTLKSDPSWNTTDIHGLGEISLKQATEQANYIPQYLGSISARAEPDLAVKYVACSDDYETVVIPKLADAETSFKSGNVAAASQAVKGAFDQIGACLNRFKQPPSDMSQFTGYSMDIQALCEAFNAVVGLLGH